MSQEAAIVKSRLPRHVALIMDGNGRWAEARGKNRLFGHKRGADSAREVIETARELGIEVITLYAFSSENWNRPEQEVSGLMSLLKGYLSSEMHRMAQNGIRLRCIGDVARLPDGPREALLAAIAKTSHNREMTLNLALSYGARDEITRAVRCLLADCAAGKCDPENIFPEDIAARLDTAGLPDPDLVIRTGGEARLSNFLLWQVSYAEMYFTDVMWPDFKKEQFLEAVEKFGQRERRFGRTSAQVQDG